MGVHRFLITKIREDGTGQLLAQFNTHLIKGIDVPDGTLHENLVLIECDRLPRVSGVSFL